MVLLASSPNNTCARSYKKRSRARVFWYEVRGDGGPLAKLKMPGASVAFKIP